MKKHCKVSGGDNRSRARRGTSHNNLKAHGLPLGWLCLCASFGASLTLPDIPVGPYMSMDGQDAVGLPPPPASPAALVSPRGQGLDVASFAMPEEAPLTLDQTRERARKINVAAGVPDNQRAGRIPAYMKQGKGLDAEGRPLTDEPMIPSASAHSKGKRAFSTRSINNNSNSVPVAPGTSDVTTATVPQHITSASSFDTVVEELAHVGGQPGGFAAAAAVTTAAHGYEFTSPQAPAPLLHQPMQQQATTAEAKEVGDKKQQQKKQSGEDGHVDVQYGSSSSSSSSSTSSSSSSSSSSARRAAPRGFPFSLLPAQLSGPLNALASLASNMVPPASTFPSAATLAKLAPTPADLSELANRAAKAAPTVARGLPELVANMPSPTTVLSVLGHVASPTASSHGSASSSSDSSSSSASSSTSSAASASRPQQQQQPKQKPTRATILAEILRVDHAGEYGAQRIYDGQLAVLGAGKRPGGSGSFAEATSSTTGASASDVIEEMRAQEIEHLRTLEGLLPQHRVRPTALLPLWHVAGFALGAGSALLGPKAAMACTVAVEEVITAHYNDQLRTLNQPGFESPEDQKLKAVIKKHRDDEEHHRDIGIEHHAKQAPAYQLMTGAITAGCHAAIWITKRV